MAMILSSILYLAFMIAIAKPVAPDALNSPQVVECAAKLDAAPPEVKRAIFGQLKWSRYIQQEPYGKQVVFLMLPHREALYGGACGGGKSSALLMAALQYADVPGYSGILFRKSRQDLEKQGGLIERSMTWLANSGAYWNGKTYQWNFPSAGLPISLSFSYLSAGEDRGHHQSAEYHFMGFEEATEMYPEDISWMQSRLRNKKCPHHADKIISGDLPPEGKAGCKSCALYALQSQIPLRIRYVTNPGNRGNDFFKRRFGLAPGKDGYWHGSVVHRPFIPAYLWDNPFLDAVEYEKALSNISDPVTREQLLRGNWGVTANGRFQRSWLRYYSINGDYICMGMNRTGPPHRKHECRWFMTIDTATTSDSIWGRAAVRRNEVPGEPNWSVISTWFLTRSWDLGLWNVVRKRVEAPELIGLIKSEYARCIRERDGQPEFVGIESDGAGKPILDISGAIGLPVVGLPTMGRDKLARSIDAQNRMERGKIWFPETSSAWRDESESELFTWTAHPYDKDDFIDTLSNAAMFVSREACGTEIEFNNAQAVPVAYPFASSGWF